MEAAGHTVVPRGRLSDGADPARELPPLGPSLEAVIVTSPRAARLYLEGVGGLPLPCPHWALGPTTRDAAAAPSASNVRSRRTDYRNPSRRSYARSDHPTPTSARAPPAMRDLVAETRLDAKMLVQPHFVVPGTGISDPIGAMPGIDHQSVDRLVETVGRDLDLGIRAVPHLRRPGRTPRTPDGSGAASPTATSRRRSQPSRKLRRRLVVMTDVCLCAYTDHGHCGLVEDGKIDNDASLPHLAAMALTHARAGADIVAPST